MSRSRTARLRRSSSRFVREPDGAAGSKQPIYIPDVDGIRTATQWLLGGLGGLALVIVAVIPLSDAPIVVAHLTLRALFTALGGIAVLAGLVVLVRSAARVLVSDRASLSDLLADSARKDAESSGVILVGSPRADASKINQHVRQQIEQARGWLLPAGADSLDAAYELYRKCDPDELDDLRSSLAQIAAFARSEAAYYRFQELVKRLLHWAGPLVLIGLITLLLACQATTEEKADTVAVTEPFPVTVHLTAGPGQLRSSGVGDGCGLTIQGVAVGGTLGEPEVALGGTTKCPAVRLRVTSDVGVAIPILK